MTTIIILIVAGVLLVGFIVSIFNRFTRNCNMVKDAWSNIDVALKLRHELIPKLMDIVKGYATYEQDTFNQIVVARNKAMEAPVNNISSQINAEKELQQALNRLSIVVESYPDLKANASFLDLQLKMSEVEERLERTRRYYNSTVRVNNTFGESIPGVFFVAIFKYQHFVFFEANPTEKAIVEVN